MTRRTKTLAGATASAGLVAVLAAVQYNGPTGHPTPITNSVFLDADSGEAQVFQVRVTSDQQQFDHLEFYHKQLDTLISLDLATGKVTLSDKFDHSHAGDIFWTLVADAFPDIQEVIAHRYMQDQQWQCAEPDGTPVVLDRGGFGDSG